MVSGAKRKNETHAAKASKATKLDIQNFKNTTKEQLISKIITLQSENEVLREENETKTDKIDELERKLETRQHKEIPSKVVSVQTEDLDRMWCIECEYPAEDIYDLGEQMYDYHAEENSDYTVTC